MGQEEIHGILFTLPPHWVPSDPEATVFSALLLRALFLWFYIRKSPGGTENVLRVTRGLNF